MSESLDILVARNRLKPMGPMDFCSGLRTLHGPKQADGLRDQIFGQITSNISKSMKHSSTGTDGFWQSKKPFHSVNIISTWVDTMVLISPPKAGNCHSEVPGKESCCLVGL